MHIKTIKGALLTTNHYSDPYIIRNLDAQLHFLSLAHSLYGEGNYIVGNPQSLGLKIAQKPHILWPLGQTLNPSYESLEP